MSSYKTAIARSSPSKPMRILEERNLLSDKIGLDFGCGRGFDADYYGLDKYDPHYYPSPVLKSFEIITCNYVLNVLLDDQQYQVLKDINSLLEAEGSAYISVRRDVKTPTLTSKGTYQCPVYLDLPILYEDSTVCIYVMRKDCLPSKKKLEAIN